MTQETLYESSKVEVRNGRSYVGDVEVCWTKEYCDYYFSYRPKLTKSQNIEQGKIFRAVP